MPTPSSDTRPTTHHGASSGADPSDTLQFRAATLEDAIALAESSLGARVRVVAANRIRRGGIGGFFAADLGVEVTVALDDETMEQALERLVADSAADERVRFEQRLAAQEEAVSERPATPEPVTVTRQEHPTTDPVSLLGSRFDRRDDEPAPTVNPVLAEVVAAIVAEAAEKQALAAAAADVTTGEQPVVDTAPPAPAPAQAASPVPTYAPPTHRAPEPPLAVPPAQQVVPQPVAPEPQPQQAPVAQEPPVRIVAPDLADEPGTRPIYTAPPTMLKVEQIMAELSAITAEPVFGERSRARVARPAGRARIDDAEPQLIDTDSADAPIGRSDDEETVAASPVLPEAAPKIIPTLPPRPSDVARRASDAAHAARARFLTNQPPDLLEPATPTRHTVPTLPGPVPGLPATATPATTELAMQTMHTMHVTPDTSTPAPEASSAASAPAADPGVVHVEAIIDDLDGLDGVDGSLGAGDAAPSQRQVELAVAATDQLIESLKREDGLKRLSVRVVLRTGDHREVEAEAEWEAS